MVRKMLMILFILVIAAGCAGREGTGEGSSDTSPVSDEKTAAASWESDGSVLQPGSKLIGNTLYFIQGQMDADTGRYTDVSIYRKKRGVDNAEEILHMGESELVLYLVDEKESIYCLYAEDKEDILQFFLMKMTKDGRIAYEVPVCSQGQIKGQDILERIGTVTMGEAGRDGSICLADTSGGFYLFDAEGKLTGTGSTGWDEETFLNNRCGLVNAGEEGIFVYRADNSQVRLQKVNMPDGKLGAEITIQRNAADNKSANISAGKIAEMQPISQTIYSGYDMGVFLGDSHSLWRYNFAGKELVKMLEWGSSSVNLKDYMIDAVGLLPDNNLFIMAHQSYDDVVFAEIDYGAKKQIQEKKTVNLAVIEGYSVMQSELESKASAFNRSSEEYQVECISYPSLMDLHMELIQGGGPDILCLGDLDLRVYAGKGILENLSPFFEASDVVKEEDLLSSVREAGTVNGNMLCILPEFQIGVLLIEKGRTQDGGWMPEDYIALAEDYPGAPLIEDNPAYYLSSILRTAMQADMGKYLDWQAKQCYFDSDEFISLINRVKDLTVPDKNEGGRLNFELETVLEKLYHKELLTYPLKISSLDSIVKLKENGILQGDFLEMAGYPNQEGKPYFELYSHTALGMNSASQEKEGVWRFLEFLLSAEYQRKTKSFPVRQDVFHKYISSETIFGVKDVDLTDREREYIRYMVKNAYWPKNASGNDILVIISEETAPVWAGDKEAEEAAKIIQNRVSLYLNE